ncbi:MAG: hypothetical protein IT578_07870 [Verrucomicrobiae bacterium]|nr:hypothetical protein [Verrucomicrobiae bacterium]
MKPRERRLPLLLALAGFVWTASARAYPEFQTWIVKNSGRSVNCAMCHAHPDGPDGTGYGQIGRLTSEEMERLNFARRAIEPGAEVQSPILNKFGNLIVSRLGMKKVLELKLDPSQLPDTLDPVSDLDRDGIPDAQELRDGTHPLKKEDGRPWRLFVNNAQRNLSPLLLTAAATAAGLYGLTRLLHGFACAARAERRETEDSGEP